MAERKLAVEGLGERTSPPVPISNSHKSREEEAVQDKTAKRDRPVYHDRPEVKPSLEKDRGIKKETFGSKLKRAWFGDSVENAGDYMIFEVGVPAMKATLMDMLYNGIEVLLFGQSSGHLSRGRDSRRAGYNTMYRRERDRDRDPRRARDEDLGYVWEQCDPPLSKSEAQSVLADLRDRAYDDDYATVADLLNFMRMKDAIEFTDEGIGWYPDDLRNDRAGIRPVRGGYVLDLPRPREIRRGR